ncbi:helix-turn-helix domain-containing protein [Streptomyces sp. NPDC007205]|uniref:winged helix-turn-helix transcriptional regulator n=1 Tax=Streptomyces sp. NPDC007205 TaxID=3154316 RepID=UPI003404FFD2
MPLERARRPRAAAGTTPRRPWPTRRTPHHQGRRTEKRWQAHPTFEPLTADADLAVAFEILGQKWNGIILHPLATCPARFCELFTAIEHISTKMLADRLRELVQAGLVTHDQVPRPGLPPTRSPATTGLCCSGWSRSAPGRSRSTPL